jgi:hypothetical protein
MTVSNRSDSSALLRNTSRMLMLHFYILRRPCRVVAPRCKSSIGFQPVSCTD